jgi:hypothetical protein
MALPIDAKRLSAVVASQERTPAKAAPASPDKWNDRLSSIRLSSGFSRIVNGPSGTKFAAVKLTQMPWPPMAVIPDTSFNLARGKITCVPSNIAQVIEPAGDPRSKLQDCVSSWLPKCLPQNNDSRYHRQNNGEYASRIDFASPKLSLHRCYLLGYRAVTVIVVVEQEPIYPARRLCDVI